ncbi:MAG: heme-binding protein [Weeksellaceae bacterium]
MITLEKARQAITAAKQKAIELNILITIAIVDEHGKIIALERMDNALTVSPDFALAKAYTSATLRIPTETLSHYAIEGKPYFGLSQMSNGQFNIIAGGLPVKVEENIVGGVGVGGSTDVNQDVQCAQVAVNVLEN